MTREQPQGGTDPLDASELSRLIVQAIADKQGEDILVLDLRPVSLLSDYFVICSAGSQRQMRAISDEIRTQCDSVEKRPLHVDGKTDSGWMLMDYGSIIVHLFTPEVRAFYDLEQLWNQAPVVVRMK
jgi:ribosome-associated protein